ILQNALHLGSHAESSSYVPKMIGFYEIKIGDWKKEIFPSYALLMENVSGEMLGDYLKHSPDSQREFAKQFTRMVLKLRQNGLTLRGLNTGDKISLDANCFRMKVAMDGEAGPELRRLSRGAVQEE